ncbi:hypothetical protein ACFX15_023649 [Malus domestica]
MDVIHSLQLILRGSLSDKPVDDSKVIVKAPSVDDRIQRVDELRIVTNEMVRLIETAVVPIFAVDASGTINGWNTKAAELTGLAVEQAIGMPLVDTSKNTRALLRVLKPLKMILLFISFFLFEISTGHLNFEWVFSIYVLYCVSLFDYTLGY